MPFTVNYRISFQTVSTETQPSEQVTIDIEDRASAEGTAVFTDLEPSANPFVFERENTGTDPLTALYGLSARFQFLSSSSVNSETFSSGISNRFFAHAYTASETLFKGFLLTDDIEERFRNPAFKNVVTLTATDGLASLKDLEMVDSATGEPLVEGHYTLLQYLLHCLNRTGLALNINIAWNLFEQDFSATSSPLTQAALHSLSFEKELTTKEDCYTVLQKIVGSLKARLFQQNGEWYLVRLHEYRTTLDTLRFIRYNSEGTELQTFTDRNVSAGISSSTDLHLINGDAVKVTLSGNKYTKDAYRFEFPREIVPNIDFTRGDLIGGTNPKTFQWEDWTVGRLFSLVTVSPYIRRTYDGNDAEDSRYAVIPNGGAVGDWHYMRSQPVPISLNDKLNIRVDWKLNDNLTMGGNTTSVAANFMHVRLVGENGQDYIYGIRLFDAYLGWHPTSGNAAVDARDYGIGTEWQPSAINEAFEWQTAAAELPPVPVGGEIYVYLFEFGHSYFGTRETHFSNLQFEYIPYINGTYAKYNGQYNKITQALAYKAKREEEVSVSNSPKKIFKGALKKFNFLTGKWVLVENWTDSFDSGASGSNTIGKILSYDTWNQNRKERSRITGEVRGRNEGYSCLLHKFTFSDFSSTKRFICVREEVDVKELRNRAEFIEVFDSASPNDYSTTHEFKYEQ